MAGEFAGRCRVRRRSGADALRSTAGPLPAAAARVARVRAAVLARNRGDRSPSRDGATSLRSCAAPDQIGGSVPRAGGAGRTGVGSQVAARPLSSRSGGRSSSARAMISASRSSSASVTVARSGNPRGTGRRCAALRRRRGAPRPSRALPMRPDAPLTTRRLWTARKRAAGRRTVGSLRPGV